MKVEMFVLFAHWCPICNMMLSLVEEMESDYREWVSVQWIDVEQSTQAFQEYDVQIVPTFIFYVNQKEVGRMAGMIGEKAFRERIEILVKGEK